MDIEQRMQKLRNGSDTARWAAAEIDQLREKLAAMESQAKQLITKACCSAVEKLTELAPNQGWDSGDVVAEMYIRQLSDKPAPADKPAIITEQDAREIVDEIMHGIANNLADYGSIYCTGFAEGRAKWILNKLNAGREQVPAVAVPDNHPYAEDIDSQLLFFWGSAYWTELLKKNPALSEETKSKLLEISNERDRNRAAAPSHSQQSAATDAERFCDAHCTWRDHHPDCPSNEREQPDPDSEGE